MADRGAVSTEVPVGTRRWFGTDGVRGVVGRTLTDELVEQIGRAATLWSGADGSSSAATRAAPDPSWRRP